VSRLAEAGRDDNNRANAFLAALLQRLQHALGRDDDDGQVNRAFDGGQGRIGGQAENLTGLGIDGVDAALEAAGNHVAHNRVTELAFGARGADHRDRSGGKQGL